MKSTRRLQLALALLLAGAAHSLRADDDRPQLTPEAMLQALRDRDARIDNYSLQFTQRETRRIDEQAEFASDQFSRAKFGLPREESPAEFPPPYDATLVRQCRLTARGDDFCVSTVWLTDQHGHAQIPAPAIVCARAGDVERSLVPAGAVLHVRQCDPDETTLLQSQRMFYEFAAGFGYGRYLIEVTEVESTDDGWRVSGRMNLFHADRTICELELDEQLLVRKAHLYCIVGPEGATRERAFDITTSGTFDESGERAVADQGTFAETEAVVVVNGQSRQVDRPGDVWEIDAGPIEYDLDDDTYSQYTAIDEASATSVLNFP
jgi:hypothetical protein